MSAGLNKVFLIGNLGSDPESRATQDGRPVVRLRMATNRCWTQPDGEARDETEWHDVKVFGAQGENCLRFLTRGRQVFVEGRLHTSSWEDEQRQRRYRTEIIARRVQFLGGTNGGGIAPEEAPRRRLEVAVG